MSPAPRRLAYRVNEAAEALGVSRRSIYRLIERHELASVKSGPHNAAVLIPADSLAAYLDRYRTDDEPAVLAQ